MFCRDKVCCSEPADDDSKVLAGLGCRGYQRLDDPGMDLEAVWGESAAKRGLEQISGTRCRKRKIGSNGQLGPDHQGGFESV